MARPRALHLDISETQLGAVREQLTGRLRRSITEMAFGSYDPGTIAGLVSDIRALDSITAERPPERPRPKPPTIDEQREEQRRAHDEHKRQEERALARIG